MDEKAEPLSLFGNLEDSDSTGPVECLGMTFEDDEARRAYFLDKLKAKLQDPDFRKTEGFPIGEDEDIIAMSDPPYYTACPNPFVGEFIKQYGKLYDPEDDDYHREPFAADVSEGKNNLIYTAHSYHTKVPYKAIMRYILHYTQPGDIVLDGFAGTGMTGIAASFCSSKEVVESLGYLVQGNGTINKFAAGKDGKATEKPISELGPRQVVLNDLSPIATFITYNYNIPFSLPHFQREAKRVLRAVEQDCGWMYKTIHSDQRTQCRINYTVWSEIFTCPICVNEMVFVNEALDRSTGKVYKKFPCPSCGSEVSKKELDLVYAHYFDSALESTVKRPKRVPVLINYSLGKNKFEKEPDKADRVILQKIELLPLPTRIPTSNLPDMQMRRVGRMQPAAIINLHHFFLPRPSQALNSLWKHAHEAEDQRIRNMLLFFVEQAIWGMSVLARYVPTHYSQVNQYLSGVFYVASQIVDVSPWYILEGKLNRLVRAFHSLPSKRSQSIISTEDVAQIGLPDNSVDYIFTDPPFGENIYYSDLNFLIESWHKVTTSAKLEAIVDRVRKKSLGDYQQLMTNCFKNYYRVLKPGRWITVEFHNSKNTVWNAIQEALQVAGFVVADVRVLDKKHGSFQQIVSGRAVKRDLVISAYKPNGGLEERFRLSVGKEDSVWDFMHSHLRQLPVFVEKDGRVEIVSERLPHLLYDRMVAFHVQRGANVPLSTAEFFEGLSYRFSERDGMYFLPEQVVDYDRNRTMANEVAQLQLFVSDEESAIQWLRQRLLKKPQNFQEIHPEFTKELGGWQKHEKPLDLWDLLSENFLRYERNGKVPSQIHSYLSRNFKELRNLHKDDPALQSKAKDRWYVPDPNKTVDLEKIRERHLLREFDEYRESKQRKLKVFRLEAVRAGFKNAWQEQDYETIIAVAKKIPNIVLQEDPKLLMWYDQAVTRISR